MTRVLITGAAGMVGRALVQALDEFDVLATDLHRGALPQSVPFQRLDVTAGDAEAVVSVFRPDVVVNIDPYIEKIVQMLSRHVSQVFEFLPYNRAIPGPVPETDEARHEWLKGWYTERLGGRNEQFKDAIAAQFGEAASGIQFVEAFEISEYASDLTTERKTELFLF